MEYTGTRGVGGNTWVGHRVSRHTQPPQEYSGGFLVGGYISYMIYDRGGI